MILLLQGALLVHCKYNYSRCSKYLGKYPHTHLGAAAGTRAPENGCQSAHAIQVYLLVRIHIRLHTSGTEYLVLL